MRPVYPGFKSKCILLASAGLLLTSAAHAQNPLAARLERAAQATSLDVEGVKPWHIKLAVQLYDVKGTPTEQGTVDEWWAGHGQRKITYAFPSYHATYLRSEGNIYRSKDATLIPPVLDQLLQQFIHPAPAAASVADSSPEAQPHDYGKVPLDCVALSQPNITLSFGGYPTYCFDKGGDALRVVYSDSAQLLRDGSGKFQGRAVATTVTIRVGETQKGSAKIAALSSIPPDPDMFKATPDLEDTRFTRMKLSGGAIAGTIIRKVVPIMPPMVKMRHISGTVLLHCTINEEGHVTDLSVVSSPDDDMTASAMAAVKQWLYRPYLWVGEPVPVDTTITVNFNQ